MNKGLPFLDDVSSWGHLFLGSLAACLPRAEAAGVALVFLLYQVGEPERLENKLGDLAEFSAGWLAAVAMK